MGLFPEALAARAQVLGNGALTGAARMLLDRHQQERGVDLTRLARNGWPSLQLGEGAR